MNPSPTPLGLETQEEELGFRSPPPLSAISSLSPTPTPVLMESMDSGKHPTGVRTSEELPTTRVNRSQEVMDPPTQGESSSLGEAQDISFIKEFVHSSQRGKEPLTVERVLETSTREQEERVEPSEIGELQDLSPRRVRKYGLPSSLSATMGSHTTPTVVTANVPAKGHVPALLMAPGSYGGEGQQELPVGSLDVKDVSDHLTEDSGGVGHHILGGTLPVPPPDNMSDTCGYARRNGTSPTLVSQGGHRESLALPVTLDS